MAQLKSSMGKVLLQAVNDGDIKAIKKVLSSTPALSKDDLNFANNGGNTPLLSAAQRFKEKDAVEITVILLKHDQEQETRSININVKNKQSMTALMFACKRGYSAVVKLLLDADAEFENKNEEGLTPMQISTDKDIIKQLRQKIKERRADEKLAMLIAISSDLLNYVIHYDIPSIKQLINTNTNNEIFTFVPYPIKTSLLTSEKIFLKTPKNVNLPKPLKTVSSKEAKPTLPSVINTCAIFLAADMNNVEMLTMFAKAGAKYSTQNHRGETVLMTLVLRRRLPSYPTTALSRHQDASRLELMKLVLSFEDDDQLECVDKNGFTVLMHACQQGYEEDVLLLLEKGIKTSCKQTSNYPYRGSTSGDREKLGDTAMTLAARRKYIDIIKILFEVGKVDINLAGADGMTALMWAAWNNDECLLYYLLERGAKINLQSEFGHTALHWSTEKMHVNVIKILLDHGVLSVPLTVDDDTVSSTVSGTEKPLKTSVSPSSKNSKTKVIKSNIISVPVEKEVESTDVNILTMNRASALIVFCRKATNISNDIFIELLKIFITRKAALNIICDEGTSALMWTACNDNIEAAKILVEAGANPNIKNSNQKTAIDFASSLSMKVLLTEAAKLF